MFISIFNLVLYVLFIPFYTNVNAQPCIKQKPEQIRVAIRNETSVTISWKTYGYRNGSDDTPRPRVQYNKDGNFSRPFSTTSVGISSAYDTLKNISWFHTCVMDVEYSLKYYYRIPMGECVFQSATFSFMSQPAVGNSTPINIVIVGDIGYDNNHNHGAASATMNALTQAVNSTHFFLHVGDISYADDHFVPSEIVANYEPTWNTFQQKMQSVTSSSFYMTLPGNHDVTCTQSYDSICTKGITFEKEYVNITSQYRHMNAYMHRFYMPGGDGTSNGSYRNLWYSFDYASVHMVIINTETDFKEAPSGPGTKLNGTNFAPDGTQVNWLINDLQKAKANRHNVPWIIVAGHRPFFSSKQLATENQNCEPCNRTFSKIIYDYGVDFYFAGHVHWYERLFPVQSNGESPVSAHNYINQTGPVYVTTGAGGAPEPAQLMHEQVGASAYYNSTYGFSKLEIKNATHCQLSFYDSILQTVIDSITVIRPRADPTPNICSNPNYRS